MNHPPLESFLSACGSDEPLRVGVGLRDGLDSENWVFRQPFLVIGRRPESDLVLDHWQVSRRHAYVQLIEGRFYCVDLGSRTGTHGGDVTERSGWLERGRAIQIGPYAVRPEWPNPAARPSAPTPSVTWELPGRAIGQAAWRMDRHLALIGRSPACKIRIVEPDVSKFHCSVVLTPQGVWVVDLHGQNGVTVNDEPVRCARLEDGDELRIGRHALRARYDNPPPPLPGGGPPAVQPARGAWSGVRPSSPLRISGPLGDLPSRMMPSMSNPPPMPSRPPSGQDLADLMGGAGGAVDPSVNLLVHQFGMMQQQMFDHFHQTMMMMFEGFATLHREQSNAIREEFDQVRKLSDEIEALRVETARLAEAATARPAERPTTAERPGLAERPRPATNGHPTPGPAPERGPSAGRRDGQGPAEAFKRATPPPPDPEADIHAQLCRRLSTIQAERQNRWQKILGMMSSRS